MPLRACKLLKHSVVKTGTPKLLVRSGEIITASERVCSGSFCQGGKLRVNLYKARVLQNRKQNKVQEYRFSWVYSAPYLAAEQVLNLRFQCSS